MKLANKEYRILDQTALQLRLDYDFLDDELDVNQLAKAMSVTLVAYSQIESKAKEYILSKKDKISDGFFVLENGKYSSPIIFYNDEMFKYRIKFTICHELGHYVSGDKKDGAFEEAKANHFARQLLVPTCSVFVCILKKCNEYDLAFKFNVSLEVATNAYTHASNRIKYRRYKLEDYEIEFMNAYYKKYYGIEFDNYQSLMDDIKK